MCVCVFVQLSVCKELQLPGSEYNYTADLVAVTSAAPLESAAVQSISVLAVAAEGAARFWPSLAQEGNYTEADVDLGDLCNFVVAVRVRRCSVNHLSSDPGFYFQCVLNPELLVLLHLVFSPLREEASSCPQ